MRGSTATVPARHRRAPPREWIAGSQLAGGGLRRRWPWNDREIVEATVAELWTEIDRLAFGAAPVANHNFPEPKGYT